MFHLFPPRCFDFQWTICARFVSTARVTPKETECARCLEAVDAATPAKDARSRGQHQDPTSAGMESATVNSDVHTPTLSLAASASARCVEVLGIALCVHQFLEGHAVGMVARRSGLTSGHKRGPLTW